GTGLVCPRTTGSMGRRSDTHLYTLLWRFKQATTTCSTTAVHRHVALWKCRHVALVAGWYLASNRCQQRRRVVLESGTADARLAGSSARSESHQPGMVAGWLIAGDCLPRQPHCGLERAYKDASIPVGEAARHATHTQHLDGAAHWYNLQRETPVIRLPR